MRIIFIFLAFMLCAESSPLWYVVKKARAMEESRHDDQTVRKAQHQAFLFTLCVLLSHKGQQIEDFSAVDKELSSTIENIENEQVRGELRSLKQKCVKLCADDCSSVQKQIDKLYELFESKGSNVYNLTLNLVSKYLQDIEQTLSQATIS